MRWNLRKILSCSAGRMPTPSSSTLTSTASSRRRAATVAVPSGRGVAHCVVEQMREHLAELVPIGLGGKRLVVERDDEAMSGPTVLRLDRPDRIVDDRPDVGLGEVLTIAPVSSCGD